MTQDQEIICLKQAIKNLRYACQCFETALEWKGKVIEQLKFIQASKTDCILTIQSVDRFLEEGRSAALEARIMVAASHVTEP